MDKEFFNLDIKQGRGFLEGICDYVRKGHYDYDEDCNGYIFRLNGQNYAIWENPSDGYRSYCEIEPTDLPCKNTFPPQEVFVRLYDEQDGCTKDNGILIYNMDDASLILKLGTDNYDDYYPTARMEFHPENLPINRK
jgi:hypothetical protein